MDNRTTYKLRAIQSYLVDVLGQTIGHGNGLHEETVVLVGRLGQAHLVRLLADSLSVGDDRVGLLDGDLGVIFLQILETDLKMELSRAGDDMLARLFDDALDHGIGLGQTLET